MNTFNVVNVANRSPTTNLKHQGARRTTRRDGEQIVDPIHSWYAGHVSMRD